jgi:serine phosphatase RsbU (regulator of sigma subunit)
LWIDKHPTIVQRQGEDLRLASLFPAVSARGEAFELLVLVPLLARQEVLGALLIQYSSDPVRNALQSLDNFFDERLSILQGIAHQTATAVENIHLQRSQQEETYVSVALLQVAQAIVSSNDLHETLGAIVRITPILTGVRRVAVYLLDQKGAQLRLEQSYGMPRDVDPFPYGLEEFPLLEAALARNALVAYPLNPVLDDGWEDVPEVWTYLPAPDQGEVAEYLIGEARLLLVYPLSVTGVILGALLVEEPDTNHNDEIGSASNLRLRPKRLEITTGISQQAALAVQNDQLKREMVERERLEQEMQLARQIQRTFLPEQMPALPGWEVEFWWQSAREVGGDFYDFISLPDGMLGLVIADVADKGISAAMFMILVRALLHASVKESISPASVLTRVNTLLVPDSHDGNFVTLFYAVLDPLRGRLTYANAGHNPPFWVRCRRHAIESLVKSSMALGVLQDIPIEERAVSLEPGDYLILYTDGVTDALSPEGLLFDSDHLYQNIWEAAFGDNQEPPSAQAMLKAIDAALQAFSRGIPPSDDSTMLILFRQPPA